MDIVRNSSEDRFEIPVFIRNIKHEYLETRLIIQRLPENAVNSKLQKIHKRNRGRKKQATKRTIYLTQFNFYITNAPKELLPAHFCWPIYSLRWQIELIFKSWKSSLKIDKFNVKTREEPVKIKILAHLIFITISSKIIGITNEFLWSHSRREISYYKALKHFRNIAEQLFSCLLCSNFEGIFNVLRKAVSFIQGHCFKIPQKDRLYPLDILELYAKLV